MMAASMGPNFTGHAAGMAHQGVAGHPMGPGMPPNAAQQGVPGAGMHQQFGGHMAVPGPGGQVNPALMGAMPPGASPHALQHLTAAQQHLYQQQQHQHPLSAHLASNHSAIAAMRQQQLLQQQQSQARQALLAQQAVHANMGGAMPMGMPLNAQHFQQLRQPGRLAPNGHQQAQAIMAQQLALQQQQQHVQQQQAAQQAAHNQQMAGGPNHGQHMSMGASGMMGMQQQPQMGGGGQGQMGGQQQGMQQGQGQAQSHLHGQSQQHAQQGQQQSQHGSQGGTPGPGGQQTPSQTPAPTPAQPNQLQQAPGQAHHQALHHGPPHMSAAATQQLMANTLFQQQQQQQQHRREGMKGQCMLKLLQFGEHLSAFPGHKGKDDISYWNSFVERFFSQNAVFRHSLHISDAEDTTDKQYEISFAAIARYFHTHFTSGVKSMQLVADKGLMDRAMPGDCHCIETSKASLVYWFETGTHLVATGTLRAQFDAEQKIELFEFLTTGHEEYISRKQVIELAKPVHVWFKDWHKVNSGQEVKQSPEMSKKAKGKHFKSPQTQPPDVLADLPDSAVNSKGVTAAVHQFLEIVEVLGQMNPLFAFCHSYPGHSPYTTMDQYVSTYINGAPPAVNGQVLPPPAAAPPAFAAFAMGASPAAAHVNLPASPHVAGSPAPGQMQAPAMQMQPSQQGTNSSGPSANTSPASNKRRRPSAVKEEDISGAPTPVGSVAQVNGIQNRPNKPPTPRMPKRHKAGP
ncbi:hypothetical protein CDD81_2537 [Ophiocordyceps australis]|uniref:Uncharacterized protein n=1 Tax=Ophiocordyceps australis TaxID=1399860 RepID=A0A2C5YCT0_9HYPO|nr:hypothetical protein CDD81_2537 [Ophiocordyceps australis]